MSIFLFHRDLRVRDNSALNKLADLSGESIAPIFVFTPEQISDKNKYKSEKSIQFMVESLESLKKETSNCLKLLHGNLLEVLESIFKQGSIKYLGFNLDYTPYAKKRTISVIKLCEKYDVIPIIAEDYTLFDMEEMRDGGYYSVFKPYYTSLSKRKVRSPETLKIKFSKTLKVPQKYTKKISFPTFDNVAQTGGRKSGELQLKNLVTQKKYSKTRNDPNIPTSLLSAHIKFGTVSIREVYYSMVKHLGKESELIRQLFWHDFYAHLVYFLDEDRTFGGGNYKGLNISWETSSKLLNAWKEGKTGVPIVDAAMRQLNETGWMHNRCRLIVSNYLSLVLHQNWKEGERYFAQRLVDYDPCSNNMNWQFSTQVGTDRVPYLRIYNPYKQSKDIDPDCEYIKTWIPELENVDNKTIHNWDKLCDESVYICPIVDFSEEVKISRKLYRKK